MILYLYLERGVKDVGYVAENGRFVTIPEKIPDIIVPDLKDFPVKYLGFIL